MVHSDRGVSRTSESREIEYGNGLVKVHSNPPLRRHRDRQPATPLGWRNVSAMRLNFLPIVDQLYDNVPTTETLLDLDLVHLVRELLPSRALASISLDRWSRLAGQNHLREILHLVHCRPIVDQL